MIHSAAAHEAGHVVCAVAHGGLPHAVVHNSEEGSTNHSLRPIPITPDMAVAGMVGEAYAQDTDVSADHIMAMWRAGHASPSSGDLRSTPEDWPRRSAAVVRALFTLRRRDDYFWTVYYTLVRDGTFTVGKYPLYRLPVN